MKRSVLSLFIAVLLLGVFPQPALASGSSPLCLPGNQSVQLEDCLPLGPSAYFNRMAALGISLPLSTLPVNQPDSSLSYLPYSYAKVTAEQGRIYATLEDAIVGKPVMRYIEPGFDYVSYIDVREVDGAKYYMIDYGWWMKGADLSAGVAVAQFMGLEFSATPVRKFGWVLLPVQARLGPSSSAELADRWYARWDVIQVYDIQEADGLTWYLVGPDLWIESRDAALVYPTTQAPQGVENGRWIEINLYEQTMAVYDNNQLVYATLTSTGLPGYWTRPGLFQIREKLETTPMSGSFEADRKDYYYLEDVPWTMYFDEARAFHGTYWHNRFGSVRSKGCANLSSGDSRWLFDWAVVGDWVYVWDPSGATPTDPSLYSAGGA